MGLTCIFRVAKEKPGDSDRFLGLRHRQGFGNEIRCIERFDQCGFGPRLFGEPLILSPFQQEKGRERASSRVPLHVLQEIETPRTPRLQINHHDVRDAFLHSLPGSARIHDHGDVDMGGKPILRDPADLGIIGNKKHCEPVALSHGGFVALELNGDLGARMSPYLLRDREEQPLDVDVEARLH
jgi:hypothetical protein